MQVALPENYLCGELSEEEAILANQRLELGAMETLIKEDTLINSAVVLAVRSSNSGMILLEN